MWFVFGFAALLASIGIALFARRDALWTGYRGTTETESSASIGKHTARIRIALKAPGRVDICLHRERTVDRVAKSLGISVEQEVGHDAFDRLVYMQSDDVRITRLLAADADARDAILAIFNWTGASGGASVRRIRVIDGRLLVDLQCGKDAVAIVQLEAEQALPARMKQLVDALAPVAAAAAETHDYSGMLAMLVLALSSGILATGGLELFARYLFSDSRTLETGRLIALATPVAIAITVALVVLAIALLGRSSRTHIVLIELLTLGLLGSLMLSHAKIAEFNEEFDRSPMVMVEATVSDKYKRRGRKSGTRYYVVLASPDPQVHGDSMQVNSALYFDAEVGQRWALEKREGALGIAWLQKYGPAGY